MHDLQAVLRRMLVSVLLCLSWLFSNVCCVFHLHPLNPPFSISLPLGFSALIASFQVMTAPRVRWAGYDIHKNEHATYLSAQCSHFMNDPPYFLRSLGPMQSSIPYALHHEVAQEPEWSRTMPAMSTRMELQVIAVLKKATVFCAPRFLGFSCRSIVERTKSSQEADKSNDILLYIYILFVSFFR